MLRRISRAARARIANDVIPRLIAWGPLYRGPCMRALRLLRLQRLALEASTARRLLLSEHDAQFRCILETKAYLVNTHSDVELHMLVSESDVLRSLWALKSFFQHAGIDPRLVVHDDGSLSPASRALYKSHFVGCELPENSAGRAADQLADYPMCRFFRQKHPISGKLLDVLLFSRGRYLIVMDSDLLWFHPSQPILDAVAQARPFYVEGGGEAYARNRRFMEEHCGLHPARNVNSGIVGYRKSDFFDLRFLDHALDRLVHIPCELVSSSLGYRHDGPSLGYNPTDPVDSIVWWVMEQTLYALLFGRCDDPVRLSPHGRNGAAAHPFGAQPIASTTALQHFISDRKWNGFFPVGVDYLMRSGFLEAWDTNDSRADSSGVRTSGQS